MMGDRLLKAHGSIHALREWGIVGLGGLPCALSKGTPNDEYFMIYYTYQWIK